MSISAIIPASGLSKRMGSPKCLLEIKGKSILAWQIDTLEEAGVDEVIVVSHLKLGSLIGSKATLIDSKGKPQEMIESIRMGIEKKTKDNSLLILPSDFYLHNVALIRALIKEHQNHSDKIIIPLYQDKKGHPIIIPVSYQHEILHNTFDQGLKSFIYQNEDKVRFLEWDNDEIWNEFNTLEEFEKVKG